MGGRRRVAGRADRDGQISEPDQPLWSAAERLAVESLRRDGIAILRFDDLIGDRALWVQLMEDVRGFLPIAEERMRALRKGSKRVKVGKKGTTKLRADGSRRVKKADFILRASAIQGSSQPHELVRYALSDRLLAISNSYLGLWSKLTYVDKWYSVPSP